METEDPRAALEAPDVHTRSAAARDLAKVGTFDDLESLVRHAASDKGSAVRLYTAAAAADILARHRGAAGQKALTGKQIEQVHAWVKAIDPGTNPGMLQMLSALGDDVAIDRLGRMMRDPRNGVRAGAAMAVRRMALSGAAIDSSNLAKAVEGWFDSGKVPADVIVELVRLVGEIGWRGFESRIRRASGLGKVHAAVAEEATARLARRADPNAWQGLWRSDGLDVMELVGDDKPDGKWIAVVGDRWIRPGGASDAFSVDPLADQGVAKAKKDAVRMVFAPKIGEPEARFAALQRAGVTYWAAAGKELVAAVDELHESWDEADRPVVDATIGWLTGQEGAPAQRALAIALWKAERNDEAQKVLTELMEQKKPRTDLLYWLGRVEFDRGKKAAARAHLDSFLEKVAKKAEFRKEAEDLRKKIK